MNLTISDITVWFWLGTASVVVGGGVGGHRVRLVGWRRESWSSLAHGWLGIAEKCGLAGPLIKVSWVCRVGIWYEGPRLHRDGTFQQGLCEVSCSSIHLCVGRHSSLGYDLC